MTNQAAIQAKRMELKEISKTLTELKTAGSITTINEGLKAIYTQQGHHELKTFDQWEKVGMHVKKGAKALYLWGKQTAKTITENGEEKEIKYFPMLAVFSDLQVYNSDNNK
jgi:hypothetical protein